MTACEDDEKIMGPVSMFVGVETEGNPPWSKQNFIDAANFCKQHGITTMIIKVAEVGSRVGDIWYGGMQGVIDIVNTVKNVGINVLTYQFLWADTNIDRDTQVAEQMLRQFGTHCLDIEGTIWEKPQAVAWGQELANGLKPIPGKLWVSCPSDPGENNQIPALQALSPATNVFMPMMYSNSLVAPWSGDIQKINNIACVQPTLDLSQEFGANDPLTIAKNLKASGTLAISLWEYQFFKQNPGLVDNIVKVFSGNPLPQPDGGQKVGLTLSTYSTYGVREVRLWYQLIEGDPDLCGICAVVALDTSVAPNQPLTVTPETIDITVDQICQDVFHVDPKSFGGVGPPDMILIMNYVRDHTHRLHYQVVPATMGNIYSALEAGYPLIGSWNEIDSTAWDKQNNRWVHATPWILSAGHVIPVIGFEPFGDRNLLVADQLNNIFQGYWPVIYRASDIAKSLSWLAVIQLPGLAPIPGPDPQKWPSGFNAQEGGTTTVTQTNATQNPSVTQLTFSQNAVTLGQTTIDQQGTLVTHGLGRKPLVVVPLLDTGYSRDDIISINYGTMNDKTFEAYSSKASSGNVRFLVL